MIIPIRCVTCGKVIADKWNKYQELVKSNPEHGKQTDTINVNSSNIQKTVEGKVLDELGLKRYCCRRHLLTHVDLIEII
jgi:DNA-directed RNA polymerases I, II, and III subunit RPABC5